LNKRLLTINLHVVISFRYIKSMSSYLQKLFNVTGTKAMNKETEEMYSLL